jgi:hypothetical protein
MLPCLLEMLGFPPVAARFSRARLLPIFRGGGTDSVAPAIPALPHFRQVLN